MKELLRKLIEKSLEELYSNDADLIIRRVAERDIVYRFAHYFENNMSKTDLVRYNVDCEYNRDGYGIKQINGSCIYPDFIIHKRGTNEDNLLVIEFKTWWNSDNSYDIEKIKCMMHPEFVFQYKYGCSITINQEEPTIFWVD